MQQIQCGLWRAGMIAGFLLVAEVAVAQPPEAGPGQPVPSNPRARGGFGQSPSLASELRREEFAAKLKLTDEQRARLKELENERLELFRSAIRPGATPDAPVTRRPLSEMLPLIKEIEDKVLAVLNAEQVAIWETRKKELEASPRQFPRTSPERDRIQKLEEEVKDLKARLEKLEAMLAAKPPVKPE
ncbi:MAG: hypothetical protein JSS49_14350 [Planctomycetes bacterium]|nr:hypothetical protein [Planctomycetota bacterium]